MDTIRTPDAAPMWRTLRGSILAGGPIATAIWLLSAAGSLPAGSADIAIIVLLAAWSPLLPVGMAALLCVDERAELVPAAPASVRELVAWPLMLVAGRARAETWASTAGIVAAAALWALFS